MRDLPASGKWIFMCVFIAPSVLHLTNTFWKRQKEFYLLKSGMKILIQLTIYGISNTQTDVYLNVAMIDALLVYIFV